MTEHDLKEMKNLGAELGAAKAENERLRGLLERIRTTCCQVRDAQDLDTAPGLSAAESLHEQIEKLDAALSPQAEPTDAFTAVDMATAAAQGFRDGQAAVEQAPAQDEREAFKRALHSQKVFKLSSATIDAAEWAWFSRPAQTEQQPIRMPCRMWESQHAESPEYASGYNTALDHVARLNATPIAQSAPQLEQSGKFAMHQRVRKTSGSEWQGRICGTYSTALTPEGYAVESEAHAGSVQIYPAKALEAVDD